MEGNSAAVTLAFVPAQHGIEPSPPTLYGCGKADQEQKTESVESPAETVETKSDKEPETEQSTITFPENFSETIGNVTLNMDIIVNADLTESSVVTAKAQLQKVNQEKAFQLYGKMSHSVTYAAPVTKEIAGQLGKRLTQAASR